MLGFKSDPLATLSVELALVCLVEEQLCPSKVYRILVRQLHDDLRRIEEPVAVVLPEVDVVGKVFRDTATDRVDVDHTSDLDPLRTGFHSLRHIPNWNHSSF